MILPRFDGHLRRRENAPGESHGEAEKTDIQRGVQGGGGAPLQDGCLLHAIQEKMLRELQDNGPDIEMGTLLHFVASMHV